MQHLQVLLYCSYLASRCQYAVVLSTEIHRAIQQRRNDKLNKTLGELGAFCSQSGQRALRGSPENSGRPQKPDIATVTALLTLPIATMVKEPTEAVAMGTCRPGLLMYKALAMARCLVDEVPEPDGTSIATGQPELWVDSSSRTEAEAVAVRSAGALGAAVMVILQLVVAESVMLGVFKDTVVMKKLFSYLCCFSGLASAALLVWILRWAGGYAASVAVEMFGVEGISSVDKTTAWTHKFEFRLWAIKVRSNANMDFFKMIGDAAVGVVEGTTEAIKGVTDISVAVAKGVVGGGFAGVDRAVRTGISSVDKTTAWTHKFEFRLWAIKVRSNANMDFFKMIGDAAVGVVEGTTEAIKGVTDISVAVAKGVVGGGVAGVDRAVRTGISSVDKTTAWTHKFEFRLWAIKVRSNANMDYFFKAVSDTAVAVAGGTAAAAKALVDTSVDAATGFSEGFGEVMAEVDSACTGKEKVFAFVDLLTKPVAGGVSSGIKFIAKTPRKVVEGAMEENTADVYKTIGATAAGLAGGTIGVMKAVVDTSADIVKGVAEGFEEVKTKADSACTEEDKVMAFVDALTTPVAFGVSAGIKTIAQTPGKVVAGVVQGIEAVIDE
ncbi:hypothetical protein AOLI_G00234990 [Acnodon oligacanthus]